MKFIPILFSTPMVQAILDGRKTQTRRVVKPQPNECNHEIFKEADWKEQPFTPSARGLLEGRLFCTFCGNGVNPDGLGIRNPYGQAGDILWVRETFRPIEQDFGSPRFEYKATETINLTDKWKPSLFMSKEACRIFLKIANVRVERLQDISEGDAEREGINIVDYNCYENYMVEKDWNYEGMNQKGFHMIEDPVGSFASLWAKINGNQSWENNPFVWVIEFKRIENPENFI